MTGSPGGPPLEGLRERLLEQAGALERAGDRASAARLRATVEPWWAEQEAWNARLGDLLAVHHEINNALVGVRGNAQLILMGPAGRQPGVRERLEVMLRESGRIKEAADRLRELKKLMDGDVGPSARAA